MIVRKQAQFTLCAGILSEGFYAHSMRDGCWSCAPFWEVIPLCPTDNKMLTSKGYCKTCKKHFDINSAPDARELYEKIKNNRVEIHV